MYDEEFGHIKIAYDESGNRVWDRKYTRGGLIWDRVTIPRFGTYNKSRYTDFELERLELVGGGFRNGPGAEAVYPLMDAQGNIRAYAGLSGIKTAYDYRPFGRENALAEGMEGDVDNRRWQDKEYDGEHGKYFFGARYFDPFFGLWMSPDPAGQYANPYTYGGDPVNFIDPTGLWGFDTGFFTIGWDSNRGWNFGLSGGFLSYTRYQNGSKTFEASIGGSYQFYFLNLGGSLGYSYNTYSGHSLSAGGHVCVGAKEDEAGVCAGLEAGGSMNWDAYGNFLGMTAYAGPFAELQASDNTSLVKVNGGYETGLFGMEGRGWYAGGSAMDGSLYANWSQNGDWSYGFSKKFNAWEKKDHELSFFSNLFAFGELGLATDLIDETTDATREVGNIIPDSEDGTVSVTTHGTEYGTVVYNGEELNASKFFNFYLEDVIKEKLQKGKNGKSEANIVIDLYVCLAGYGGESSFAQELANYATKRLGVNVTVRAATGYVVPRYFSFNGKTMSLFNKDRVESSYDGHKLKVNNPSWQYYTGRK